MMRGLLFLLCLFYCLTATGMSIERIIQQKGQPTWMLTLPNGNKVYTYITQYKQNFPSYTTKVFVVPGGHAIGINVPSSENRSNYIPKCTTTYEVNKKGIIVSIESSGSC